jgi:hypothetical protein
MNIGNELYSNLSCLAQQSFLLFTELPSQLTVFDTDYIFEYTESYSGNVIGDCSIEGFQYCVTVPFHRSFELLLADNYSAFILTIDSNCSYRMDFPALHMRSGRIFGMANRAAMLFCLVLFSRRTKRF